MSHLPCDQLVRKKQVNNNKRAAKLKAKNNIQQLKLICIVRDGFRCLSGSRTTTQFYIVKKSINVHPLKKCATTNVTTTGIFASPLYSQCLINMAEHMQNNESTHVI